MQTDGGEEREGRREGRRNREGEGEGENFEVLSLSQKQESRTPSFQRLPRIVAGLRRIIYEKMVQMVPVLIWSFILLKQAGSRVSQENLFGCFNWFDLAKSNQITLFFFLILDLKIYHTYMMRHHGRFSSQENNTYLFQKPACHLTHLMAPKPTRSFWSF